MNECFVQKPENLYQCFFRELLWEMGEQQV